MAHPAPARKGDVEPSARCSARTVYAASPGEFLSAELALALGRAAAAIAPGAGARRCSSCATRASRARCSRPRWPPGWRRAAGTRCSAACCPRPGAALLVRRHGFDLAAVVSASHNPYRDNGIKFFGPDGMKVSDEQEARIEAMVLAGATRCPSRDIGRVRELHGAAGRLPARAGAALPRPRPVGPPGAARLRATAPPTSVAPEIFRRLGAELEALAVDARTGATSTTAWAPRTSTRWRSGWPRAATTSASPSTATATACWRWTATAPWWTATSCWRSRRCTCARRGACPATAWR